MNYCHNIYCRCVSTGLSEIDIFKMENECLVDELVELKKQKESIEKKEKAIRNKLMATMCEHHIESFETDSAKVSYVESADFIRIDSEKLKRCYPSIYHNCCCYSFKDDYLVLRVKK